MYQLLVGIILQQSATRQSIFGTLQEPPVFRLDTVIIRFLSFIYIKIGVSFTISKLKRYWIQDIKINWQVFKVFFEILVLKMIVVTNCYRRINVIRRLLKFAEINFCKIIIKRVFFDAPTNCYKGCKIAQEVEQLGATFSYV